MIGLPSFLPYIRIGARQVTPCEPDWLRRKLRIAATQSELPDWFADDIVDGVIVYLRERYPESVITLDDLYGKIHQTLEAFGLPDMAENLHPAPPPVQISLCDIARRAGACYELAFFPILEARFQEAAADGAEQLYCYGLRPCVKRLRAVQRWSPGCEQLRDEISHFLESAFRRASAARPSLALTVL